MKMLQNEIDKMNKKSKIKSNAVAKKFLKMKSYLTNGNSNNLYHPNQRDSTNGVNSEEGEKDDLEGINNNSFIKELFYRSTDAITIYNKNGFLISLNNSAVKLCKIDTNLAQNLCGKYNILEDKQLLGTDLLNNIKKAFKGESVKTEPFLYDGNLTLNTLNLNYDSLQKLWVELTAFPIKDSMGNIENVIITMIDLTKEIEVETELKYIEERYRLLADLSQEALIVHQERVVLEVNTGFCKMFDYKAEEIIGTDPFKRLLSSKSYNEVKNNFNSDDTFSYDLLGVKKDGTEINIIGEARAITYKGKKARVVSFRDVTIRKNAQTLALKLSKAVDQSPESIAITDKDGIIEYANSKFKEITGYKISDYVGKTLNILDSGYHNQAFYDNIRETVSRGKVWEGEIFNKKKNGELHWENTKIAPIKNELGEIINYVTIKEDITEKKKLIEDLRIAKDKAEESDRLKSAFLANMSHEIRTPMNGILGFANLLKENNLTGEEKLEYIDIIEESGDRMLNTLLDIIDISKIETGEVTINYSEVNLNEQIHYLHDFFNPEAKKKGIHIKLKNGLTDEQATIRTDKRKIISIFTNLVKNAVKYTNEGSIEFGYNLKNEGGTKTLEFFVKDTGIGIPSANLESVFNRFVQVDLGDNRVYEGSGLGLSIAKAYVEMLNGKIWIDSEEGVGSQVNVSFPYDVKEDSIEVIEPIVLSNLPDITIKKLIILIADDQVLVRKYLSIILKNKNRKILFAKTGKETVEIFKNNPNIDLILMDVKMPEFDGFEATRRIRQLNKDVIIIIQTAFVESSNKDRANDVGANYIIEKPINKKKLLNIIANEFS